MWPTRRLALALVPLLGLTVACGGSADGGAGDGDDGMTGPAPSVGAVEAVTSTAGTDPDPNGYQLTLTEESETRAVAVDDTVIFDGLDEGSVTLELSDVVVNCVSAGAPSQTVGVTAGDTTTVEFAVDCEPAGTIAFQTERDGNWNIYLMKGNGEDVRNLPTGDANQNTHPVWRPDGEMIAYHSGSTGQTLTIARVEPKDAVSLIAGDLGIRGRPAWSPDGEQVVFFGAHESNLYTIDRDGSNRATIVENTFSVLETEWSPDGQRVAFSARIDPDPQSAWTVRPDGSDRVKLIDNNFNSFFPDFTPDGRRVVFVSQNVGLFVADPDGGNRTQLTGDGDAQRPQWSPSGDRIVFQAGGDLVLIDPDGSNRQQLTESDAEDFDPEFSPDGRRIVFTSFRDGDANVYAIRTSGENLTRLTDDPGGDARPTWRP